MFSRTWIPRLITGAVLAGATALAVATPVVIDFEDTPPLTLVGPGQPEATYIGASSLRYTPTGGDALIDLSFCALGFESCISNNASVYLTALNGAELTIASDHWFDVQGFAAAYFPLPTPPGLFSGLGFGLKLTGTTLGGGTVEQVVALAEDPGFPGDFIFSQYAGDASLNHLTSLTLGACFFVGTDCVRSGADFDGAGLLFNDLQFAIDDLALNVPEPSGGALVALSLAALALTRRRRAA